MNILLHAQVTSGPFVAHKVDFDALDGVDMSELGFDVLCPTGVVWDSFVSTWKNFANFYLEENLVESEENEDVVPSVGDVAPPNNIDKVGSFALTNYVGSCSFYPAILSMIAGSFALTNCVGDYDFNPVSLNMTVGSFALANCVGGYDFSLASLI
ncbi:hypothetical protein PVK06_048134 [Gossypium arboreum]|uniref:Uncharacterized protein n=1 Tax=Gossypium arboreum TaxID=29729 RepID=A0ABR0MF75_GOSAR|nr:hypothetical protein PVK06_048134 [Gossypium arboreum]